MTIFIKEFILHPKRTGAIAPSSRRLATQMMEAIDFDHADCIVEYGPGTGAFTRELVRRKGAETSLILIEQNENFYQKLKDEFGDRDDIHLVCGSAEDVKSYLEKFGFTLADYIVSGLPFTSLPKAVSHKILKETGDVIGKTGTFITFQYSLVKKALLEGYFSIKDCTRVLFNLPPAYVLQMKQK